MLTGKYDVHYVIFKLSYPVAREREIIKWGFWRRLLVLWHFCGAACALCKIESPKLTISLSIPKT